MDELQLYTYIAVFGSFALYFALAWWARAGSTSDFYVASGSISSVQNGMAIGADWMSAASFISMAGLIAFLGYGGSVFLMGWTGGYVLLAMLLAPYMRKHGKFTVPEFIADRYYSKTARIVAVVCLIIASLTYIIGQMKGVGVAFSRFLEVDYEIGLAIGMGVVWVYAVLGGMKGITYSSAGYALVCIALLYTVAPAVGAMARLNLMNTISPSAGENLEYEERPQWFRDWEKTGLLKFEDKNGDGKIQYLADEEKNEMVKVDKDIMVLANPAIANLPNWVIALVAAGGLAAALSTAAGLLLAISSAISHDLMKGVLTPGLSEKKELLSSRIVMSVSILIAGYLGLNPPGFAAGTVALAFGLAASSIFPALMMGIFSKKMSGKAAIWGMVSGIGITMLYVFQHKGIMFIPGTSFLGTMEPNWFFGISPNAFGAVGALVNFAVAFAVLQVTGSAPEKIQAMVDNFRNPKDAGEAAHH